MTRILRTRLKIVFATYVKRTSGQVIRGKEGQRTSDSSELNLSFVRAVLITADDLRRK